MKVSYVRVRNKYNTSNRDWSFNVFVCSDSRSWKKIDLGSQSYKIEVLIQLIFTNFCTSVKSTLSIVGTVHKTRTTNS